MYICNIIYKIGTGGISQGCGNIKGCQFYHAARCRGCSARATRGFASSLHDIIIHWHFQALEQCEEVGDVLAGDTESDVLEKELEALLLSSAESSLQAPGDTEDSHLADQLSQLQLISPPATDPAGSSGAQLQRKTAASTLPMSHSKQKLM